MIPSSVSRHRFATLRMGKNGEATIYKTDENYPVPGIRACVNNAIGR